MNKYQKQIHNHINNVFGWKTKRKIVVIESDDWGSIRMSGKKAFNTLLKAGIPVDKSHYNLYDGLESNTDLEGLLEVLRRHIDGTGRHPVITCANIVANPDFERIRENNYDQYYYEPVTNTYKRYGSEHDKVNELWDESIEKRLLFPVFHGREHVNVLRMLRVLKAKERDILLGFENGVTGIPTKHSLQDVFAVDKLTDIAYHKDIITDGLDLFENLYGFRSNYFIPPNGLYFNASSYELLAEKGIKFLNTRKRTILPDENGRIIKELNFSGKKNKFGQYYFIRNCFFEPSSMEHPVNYDWIGNCMKEIETAFFWKNPAIFSSHRVNYIGWLHPENRDRGLATLDILLTKIIKTWPDVEFMTTTELGDLIAKKKDN